MRIAHVRAGGHGYARAGGVILKMGKWGAPVVVGKNEQASSAKFFSGTTRRATEGSPQRDKAVAGRLQKAAEQKELPRRVAEEEKVES